MNNSPAFSEFRSLMDLWDETLSKEKEQQIKTMLSDNELDFFFVNDDTVYGATEDGRLIFAKMKNPDEEADEDWLKDANFMAYSLTKALENEKMEVLFSVKDINTIKVIDHDQAYKILAKLANKTPGCEKNIKFILNKEKDTEIPGLLNIGEK